jgi:ion channel POLLUX/CASTOR
MSINATWREHLRYRVDNFLAKGSGALFLALVIAFLLAFLFFVLLRGVVNLVTPEAKPEPVAQVRQDPKPDGEDPPKPMGEDAAKPEEKPDEKPGFGKQVWTAFVQVSDPGAMTEDNDSPVTMKLVAICAAFSGVIIFSALVAFLTTALTQAIDKLKQGHSRVLESNHTLILGWGPRVSEILRELAEANESEKNPCVTILSEHGKESMDEYLGLHFKERKNTRIVTRSGPIASLESLDRVSAATAKSAIVLATCGPAATQDEKLASDAHVIKAVLALDLKVGKRDDFNIVAEIFSQRNRHVVMDINPDRVVVVNTEEILAKIMVQTSRTSGLSVVYSELLSFIGSELYFHHAKWNGITFGAMQYHFPDGVPIGLRKADGTLLIRPEPDTVLEDDDEVLIIAQDDSTIDFRTNPVVKSTDRPLPKTVAERQKERMLILGWSPKAPIIASEYADYVLDGSEVDVVIAGPSEERRAEITDLSAGLDSMKLTLIDKNPLDSNELESLNPFGYNNIVILPQRPDEQMDAERTDAETIVLLLHLRRMQRNRLEKGLTTETKILTEVLDSNNQDLICKAGVNDFLISSRMVSMIFAQLSEEPKMIEVYDNLFQEEGSEIYVKPASLYFTDLPQSCTYADLMALAQKRNGEVCIGYKLKSLEQDGTKNFGVSIIPPKETIVEITAEDALVVVAEDDQ